MTDAATVTGCVTNAREQIERAHELVAADAALAAELESILEHLDRLHAELDPSPDEHEPDVDEDTDDDRIPTPGGLRGL